MITKRPNGKQVLFWNAFPISTVPKSEMRVRRILTRRTFRPDFPEVHSMPSYPLKEHWPYDLDVNSFRGTIKNQKNYQIGSFDGAACGFPLTPFDGPAVIILTHYKNGMRLLNSKISFQQLVAEVFSEELPPGTLPSAVETHAIALCSILRNFSFSIKIRNLFIGEIKNAQPLREKLRRAQGASNEVSESYSSPLMDAWLFCEHRCGRHDPESVNYLPTEAKWRLEGDGAPQLSTPARCY